MSVSNHQLEVNWPSRLPLAQTPTPFEPLREDAPISGWIKRDDLTGIAESGNKIRKLEFLLAEARALGARAVITCGGVNSNHARATAVAARRLGLDAHLLLRGEDRPPMGNLLLDRILGADVRFIPPESWPDRDALMTEWAGSIADAYVIPQGGSNAVGALGYVRAAEEIIQQAAEAGIALQTVVHAAGSGGTTAGLALGFAALDRHDVRLIGVKVDEDPGMERQIEGILNEAVERGFVTSTVRTAAQYELVEGWGRGYALTTRAEIESCVAFARATGIFVDPVYTGKAVHWLARQTEGAAGQTVFVHTGGIFELFAYADAFSASGDTHLPTAMV